MLYQALLDLLTIQSSRHDGNTTNKHSDDVVIFTIFSLGHTTRMYKQQHAVLIHGVLLNVILRNTYKSSI